MKRLFQVVGFVFAVFVLVLIYGFNPWFRPAIRAKKLPQTNPTSFIFEAPIDRIESVLKGKAVRCCGDEIEFSDGALFSGSLLRRLGNEDDAYIHNFHQPIGPSPVYFAGRRPLPYICEFQIHISAKSAAETEVKVIPFKSEVIEGESWWGLHGGPANIYTTVAPTTVEEYEILLELGAVLDAKSMPPLIRPAN